MLYHCRSLSLVALIAGSLFWLLLKTMTLQAAPLVTNVDRPIQSGAQAPVAQPTPPQDAPTIGYPCGKKENPRPNALCLYGVVRQGGQPVIDAEVTVAIGDESKDGKTKVRKNDSIPTYALNLGKLNPHYLQTAIVTATLGNLSVRRELVLFWDWETHNQRFDIDLDIAPPVETGLIFGQVIHYASGGPVAGAHITATNGSITFATTTTDSNEPKPGYRLDLSQIPVNQLVSVTAFYSGYIASTVISRTDAPQELHLVTGRPCDSTDNIPRQGTGRSLPDDSKTLPDEGCFWGKVLFNGSPRAGVEVRLTISNTTYLGTSSALPGEKDPRYAIAVPSIARDTTYQGVPMTVTAVYSGIIASQVLTVSLDVGGNQQIETIKLADTEELGSTPYSNLDDADFLVRDKTFLWWIESSLFADNLIRYDLSNHSYTLIKLPDSIGSLVQDMALSTDSSLWLATNFGVGHYYPIEDRWETFTEANGLLNNSVNSIAINKDGSLWFGVGEFFSQSGKGVSHYIPGATRSADRWINYTSDNSPLLSGTVKEIEIANDGSLWFVGDDYLYSITHYIPGVTPDKDQWDTFYLYVRDDIDHAGYITSFEVDSNNSLWLAIRGALTWQSELVQYTLGSTHAEDQIRYFTPDNSGLSTTDVDHISIGNDGTLWFASDLGVNHYIPSTDQWETFTELNGLSSNNVNVTFTDDDNSVWFGTSARYYPSFRSGVSHYIPTAPPGQRWSNITTIRRLAGPDINVILRDQKDSSLWLGTTGGVNHYLPGKLPEEDLWQVLTIHNSGLVDNNIKAISFGGDASLWFGTDAGLSHYWPQTGSDLDRWETYTTVHGVPITMVTSIVIAQDGSLWVGTENGLGHYKYLSDASPRLEIVNIFTATPTTLVSNRIQTLAIGKDNSIWIGTDLGINHYAVDSSSGQWVWETFTTTNTQGLKSNDIRTIIVANDSSIWFGLAEDGVSRYIPMTNQWESIPLMFFNYVNTIGEGEDGVIWIGSTAWDSDSFQDGGLDRYTPGGHPQLESIWRGEGVTALSIDPNNRIWFAQSFTLNQWEATPQQSDLVIQVSPINLPLQGVPVTYVITVTNNGRRDAFNSVLQLGLTNAEFSNVEPAVDVDVSDPTQPVFLLPTVPATGTRQLVLKVTTTLAPAVMPGDTVTALAVISTTTPEAFLSNNTAVIEDSVRDPYKAQLHVTINAPPILVRGTSEIYTVTLGNSGGLTATNIQLNIELPPGIQPLAGTGLQHSIPPLPPTPREQVGWQLGIPVTITTTAEDVSLVVNANADYSATADGQRSNAPGQAEARTSLKQARTLFLVAPNRMKGIYVTELMNKLHVLAKREDVKGVVIDVLRDETVRQAYAAWAANPGSNTIANAVAQAIKTNLIDRYTKDFPNLRYLVFVGDDEVIPFYRASDGSNSEWPEHSYASESLPNGVSVRAALLDDILLTDDFYADRTSTSILVNSQPYTLFVPDFASGRLVETPEQIMVALDTFIRSNGILNLAQHPTALVGMDKELTADLGEQLSSAINNEGLQSIYTTSTRAASDTLISPLPGLVVNAQHSNHASLGEWPVENISGLPDNAADQRLLLLFGCHAGLNVSAPAEVDKRLTDLDLAEAWLSKGGVVIGSKAYAYASRHEMAYSEIFAEQFLNRLLTGTVQLLGPTLIQTKQEYFATRQASSYFDPLDTKVLLPMTLYGLPMWQVQTPQTNSSTPEPTVMAQSFTDGLLASSPITSIMRPLGASLVMTTVQGEGQYYALRYQGRDHTSVRKGYPMQPAYSFNLPATDDGRVAHGVVLRSVTYDEKQSFDPVIADIWVLDGEPPTTFLEPAIEFTGWDHAHFYSFGAFIPLTAAVDSRSQAKLNLILGNYHRETQTERLFDDFTFEVLYSSATLTDFTAPVVMTPTAVNITGTGIANQVIINVQATDTDSAIVAAVGVCDDGRAYHAMTMIDNGTSWSGVCQPDINRFYVQVIDTAGNVAPSVWITKPELITLVPVAYLPVVPKDYMPPLPDLIVSKIVATEQNITVAIRNIGAATVVDDFWVDACFDPEPIPTKVNQICKGLSFQYVMWAYLASQRPIAPGQTVTLTVDDTYYTSTHSIFTPTFTIGTPIYAHVDAAHKFTTYGGVLETHERAGGGYNNILSSTAVAGPVEQVLPVVQTDLSLERAQPASNLPPLPDVPLAPAIEEILSTDLPPAPVVDEPFTPVITQTLALSNTESLSTTEQMQFIWLPILLK